MAKILWQGNSEQVWSAGDFVEHSSQMCERQLDFRWLDDDDIRRIASADHSGKISVYGTREEVDRLGPLLVDFLNANRLASQMHRPQNGGLKMVFIGHEKDGQKYWLVDACSDCAVSLDKASAWDFKKPGEALMGIVRYLEPTLPWFVEFDGKIIYDAHAVASTIVEAKVQDIISQVSDESMVKELGTISVTSDGSGLYTKGGVKQTVPVTIVATVDPTTIQRNPDGTLDFAYCHFKAVYSPLVWAVSKIGVMYTDCGIENGINTHLASLGYTGKVGWSERGRQEAMVADFDMDYTLLDEIWPDLLKKSPETKRGTYRIDELKTQHGMLVDADGFEVPSWAVSAARSQGFEEIVIETEIDATERSTVRFLLPNGTEITGP